MEDNYELNMEHNFSFNKTNVHKKLIPLLNEIEENNKKWKSLYIAVWGLPLYFLKPYLIDKLEGDKLIPWGLPAAKLKQVLYTPNELNEYLTNYDHEIHISQLIKIFTLLENYLFEYHEITNNSKSLNITIPELDFTRFKILKKYLKDNKLAIEKEIAELEYVKETRNSFVHRRGLVNKVWLKAYKKTGRENPPQINETISLHFHDLEDWTNIITKIVKKSLETFDKIN